MYASRAYPITRDSMTAEISSRVAENAVCWCDGRKKRRSFVMGGAPESQSYRNLRPFPVDHSESHCKPADVRIVFGRSAEVSSWAGRRNHNLIGTFDPSLLIIRNRIANQRMTVPF